MFQTIADQLLPKTGEDPGGIWLPVSMQSLSATMCLGAMRLLPAARTVVNRAFFASEGLMLKWALFFLIISIIAGLFGFTGISAAAAGIAKVLFFIFIVIFVVLLVLALVAGRAIL